MIVINIIMLMEPTYHLFRSIHIHLLHT